MGQPEWLLKLASLTRSGYFRRPGPWLSLAGRVQGGREGGTSTFQGSWLGTPCGLEAENIQVPARHWRGLGLWPFLQQSHLKVSHGCPGRPQLLGDRGGPLLLGMDSMLCTLEAIIASSQQ